MEPPKELSALEALIKKVNLSKKAQKSQDLFNPEQLAKQKRLILLTPIDEETKKEDILTYGAIEKCEKDKIICWLPEAVQPPQKNFISLPQLNSEGIPQIIANETSVQFHVPENETIYLPPRSDIRHLSFLTQVENSSIVKYYALNQNNSISKTSYDIKKLSNEGIYKVYSGPFKHLFLISCIKNNVGVKRIDYTSFVEVHIDGIDPKKAINDTQFNQPLSRYVLIDNTDSLLYDLKTGKLLQPSESLLKGWKIQDHNWHGVTEKIFDATKVSGDISQHA
jgi:hypothetical protein